MSSERRPSPPSRSGLAAHEAAALSALAERPCRANVSIEDAGEKIRIGGPQPFRASRPRGADPTNVPQTTGTGSPRWRIPARS
eukprot:9503679-Pyramimonas_sp.AAC.1